MATYRTVIHLATCTSVHRGTMCYRRVAVCEASMFLATTFLATSCLGDKAVKIDDDDDTTFYLTHCVSL